MMISQSLTALPALTLDHLRSHLKSCASLERISGVPHRFAVPCPFAPNYIDNHHQSPWNIALSLFLSGLACGRGVSANGEIDK